MGKWLSAAAFSFDDIRNEFALPTDYPAQALDEAKNATDRFAHERDDRTDIPFVTIDPPGSMDLHHFEWCISCTAPRDAVDGDSRHSSGNRGYRHGHG